VTAGSFRLIPHDSPTPEKHALKPWQQQPWALPAVSAEVVAHREAVLELYAEPSEPQRPKVTCEETRQHLLAETRPPLPANPGEVERYDSA
jgi:hypothetical protein